MSEQRIAYPNNIIMAIAWRDGLRWALGSDEIVSRFESETKIYFPKKPRSGIEVLVDQACGVVPPDPTKLAVAFMEWFNKEIWGEDPFAERCECGQTPHLKICPEAKP